MARYQQKTIINFGNSVDVARWQQQRQWQQAGQISSKIGGVAQKFLESETKRKASIAGMMAGQKHEGGLQTGLSSYTTYGQQYNESYVAAYGADIALEANQKINEFAVDANTPDEFMQMVGGYRKGLMSGVSDPVLQGLADSKINQYAAAPYKAMLKAQQEREIAKAEVSNKGGLNLLSTDAVSAWGNAETEDELKAADIAQNEFFSVINAMVNSDDPKIRISPETADEMTSTYNAQRAEALITGSSFTREIENGRGFEYIEGFRNINPIEYSLTTEQHSKLVTKMDKQLKAHLKYLDRLDDEADDALELEQSRNNIKFLLNPDSLTDDALSTALANGDITEKSYNSLVKLMDEGEDESNKIALAEIYVDLSTKGPDGVMERAVQMAANGEINATDFKAVYSAVQSGMGSTPTQRKEYNKAESLLKLHFVKTGPTGNILGKSGEKLAQRNIELYNRVKDGEDPMDVAIEMISVKAVETGMTTPEYWRGNLADSEAALSGSYKAAGKDPSGSDKEEYNSDHDHLVEYAKYLEAQQAVEAYDGK